MYILAPSIKVKKDTMLVFFSTIAYSTIAMARRLNT